MNNEKVPTKYSAEAKITRDKEKIQNEENLTIFVMLYFAFKEYEKPITIPFTSDVLNKQYHITTTKRKLVLSTSVFRALPNNYGRGLREF